MTTTISSELTFIFKFEKKLHDQKPTYAVLCNFIIYQAYLFTILK